MLPIQQRVQEAARAVRESWQASGVARGDLPQIIITTGSGLGQITQQITRPFFEMSYEDIPHLPPSRMLGHAGRLVIGTYANTSASVIVLDGRVHGYEGHDPLTQILPLLIAHELCGNARLALFTNAAGAINESYAVGDLVLIKDHINFTGQTALALSERANFGSESMDMTFVYTPKHRSFLKEHRCEGRALHEGVYIGVKGPMYETPAEIRAFRMWGADVVGMSTVHEATAASRLELEVVGISVVTNMAAGIEARKLTHQEVLDNTAHAADAVCLLAEKLITALPR